MFAFLFVFFSICSHCAIKLLLIINDSELMFYQFNINIPICASGALLFQQLICVVWNHVTNCVIKHYFVWTWMSLLQACSNIYFTMDSLNQIHFLYQYSLKFFLDIFSAVLYSNPKLSSVTDYGARLAIITRDLFGVSEIRFLCL